MSAPQFWASCERSTLLKYTCAAPESLESACLTHKFSER